MPKLSPDEAMALLQRHDEARDKLVRDAVATLEAKTTGSEACVLEIYVAKPSPELEYSFHLAIQGTRRDALRRISSCLQRGERLAYRAFIESADDAVNAVDLGTGAEVRADIVRTRGILGCIGEYGAVLIQPHAEINVMHVQLC